MVVNGVFNGWLMENHLQMDVNDGWLVVWNIVYFPYIWIILPIDKLIFFKMVKTTNQSIYINGC